MLARTLAAGLLTILLGGPAFAEEPIKSPPDIPGATKVTAEQVIETANRYPDLIIIDARIRMDRRQGYLEGSISLPDVDTTCESLGAVLPAMDSPVLFYCNGPRCGRSAKSVKRALACGYTNIFWFRGGYEEWQNKHYPVIKN